MATKGILFVLLLTLTITTCKHNRPNRPHVVFYVIDDIGWTDVGYREGSGVSSPVLDHMAHTGVLLDKYYVQPVCSPTRSCFLQGKYPFTTGLQLFSTIMPASRAAMPLDQPTLSELFLENGYRTSAVGKWHLGYADWRNTPTGRGFESHTGYFQGEITYYSHAFTVPNQFVPYFNITGLDWWNNKTVDRSKYGVYSKDLLDKEMKRVLDNYTPSKEHPLFMYYAHQLVHVPLDKPEAKWFENCTHIKDEKRNIYCAMIAAADDSLKQLIDTLKKKKLWDDTILVVTTDNGAMPDVPNTFPPSAGVNYPLRAGKGTVFEGGVRAIGFVNGGKNVIPESARGTIIKDQLLHAVDWFPTLINMANPSEAIPSNLDGFDIWDTLVNNQSVPRESLPLNINHHISFPNSGHQVAVIKGDWKLIKENVNGPVLHYDGWFPVPPNKPIPAPENDTPGKFLFNLKEDPYEHTNLFHLLPSKVIELEKTIEKYMEEYVEPQWNWFHPNGMPEFHHGVWAPFE
eukprot:TRINITY_DN1749_c3_g1_i1.p1 TRINITY_DN1749_c3_g1~~TRINITY_DN1749_c3_g1_i1.p1  ORF type:complete len:514 (-),score=88.58 TRINITY_DN1749_c3_g1_i1:111-1652(-)